ncbi:MAG: hypothetical protein K0S51_1010 [Bacillales bacterium]|nr:hypothetical protein [Bacillales bacterium]
MKLLLKQLLIIISLLLLTSCATSKTSDSYKKKIKDIKEVFLKIDTSNSTLHFKKTQHKEVVWAEFEFGAKKPKVKYRNSNNIAYVNISGPGRIEGQNLFGNIYNKIDARVYKNLPLNLEVKTGTNFCRLDLTDLDLKTFDLNITGKEKLIDFSRVKKQDMVGTINIKNAETIIIIPKNIDTEINVSGNSNKISAKDFFIENSILRLKKQPHVGKLLKINLEIDDESALKLLSR